MKVVAKLAVVGPLLLGGCVSIPSDAGFSDVQNTASTRLGVEEVRWNRGEEDDKRVNAAIARMLESPLTPSSAVQIALLNNRRMQAEYESLGIARAELLQAGLLENPSLSAEILIGNGAVSPSISLVQNFLNLLTLPARSTIASSAFEAVKFEVSQKVLDLAADVRSTYYKLVADQQSVDFFRQVVSATEAGAELAFRQGQAGNINRRDQALQQSLYAQAILELARAEARLASDREMLSQLLGLSGDQTAWNLPDRLPDIPSAKPSIDGLETLAIERRLDLAGARQELLTSTQALDLARQLRFLSVLGLGVKFEKDPENGKWLKGPVIELVLPIFDQGQARIASLEAQQRRSEKLVVALAVDVRAQVREAWARLVAAHDAASYYQSTILPLQEQIIAESQRLATGMLISIYDVLRSKQDQINAGREYIGALKDYWTARADLERAIAGPLPDAGASATQSSQNPGS